MGIKEDRQVYFEKIRVLKVGLCLPIVVWNNKIGLLFCFFLVVLETEVIIKRDCWGYMYVGTRSEILRSSADKLLQKHLPRMFSLIKNGSQRVEDDQIPS